MRKRESSLPIIGIVLPAYNEAVVIRSVIRSLPRSITIRTKTYRILPIVVNDGSHDATARVVASQKHVKLINHVINSGVGAATRTGLHYARDIGCIAVVTMDSDGQHSTKDVLSLIKEILKSGSADLVIGNRLSDANGNMPTFKRIGNRGLGLVTYVLLGTYVSDSQSGLRAWNEKALETIEFHSNDYAFCSEVIWKARRAKLKIAELPIKAIYTEYSMNRATAQKNLSGGINIVTQLLKRRFMDFLHG